MTTYTFDVTINIRLNEGDVRWILSNAIEHCIRTWCCGIEVSDDTENADITNDIIQCKPLWFYTSEHTAHRLNLNAFLDGFRQWICDGHDICGIVMGNGAVVPELMDDYVGCDQILQYALFGRIKYDEKGVVL